MPRSSGTTSSTARRARDTRDPLIGTRLDDRFAIEARIATGGFGAVYRARAADGAHVALKILHPWLTDDPNMVARFQREGAILTQLHDPHTVTTLAVGETCDGLLYIAMELLSGESLHDRLQRTGALPWQTAVAIARAVCSSLAEAHALGVVHRDLKPANIQIEARDGDPDFVKVLDFGIGKIERGSSIDDGKDLTYAGHMIGTYDYMSPEQIVGDTCRGGSDIYSLGLVLYEMLTGRRPFDNVTGPTSMMAAMLTQLPVPPSVLVATPPALDRVVMRCLQRDPEHRFGDVRELAAALDRALAPYDTLRDEVTVERPTFEPSTIDDQAWGAGTGELPWAMPRVDARGEASPGAAIGPRAMPVAWFLTTLPGVAVPTELRPRRAPPAATPAALTAPHRVVPLGWRPTPRVETWIPAPAPRFEPPIEQLASGSGRQLPTRSRGALWIALAIACAAAVALATLL
jgi:serine/threonine-protein kinase